VCDGHHTIQKADGTAVDCAPYRCTSTGTCLQSCASTADCVTQLTCNSDGLCVEPVAAAEEAAGCSCRTTGGHRSSGFGASLALLGLLGVARWRRKHRVPDELSALSLCSPASALRPAS
jgi:MYXO-CTERM domain-containing protein